MVKLIDYDTIKFEKSSDNLFNLILNIFISFENNEKLYHYKTTIEDKIDYIMKNYDLLKTKIKKDNLINFFNLNFDTKEILKSLLNN